MKIVKKIILLMLVIWSTSLAIFGMENSGKNSAETEPNSLLLGFFTSYVYEPMQILQEIADLDVNTYNGLKEAIKRLCLLRAVNTYFRNFLTPQKMALILLAMGATQNPEQKFKFVTATNEFGYTALHHAAINGHIDIEKVVLETIPLEQKFAFAMATDEYGDTALHEAADNKINRVEIVRTLLEALTAEQRVAFVTARNKLGYTALHYAAMNFDTDIVRMLVWTVPSEQRTAFVMATNECGRTALHSAAIYGYVDVAKILLESVPAAQIPTFIMATDESHLTALHWAQIRNNSTMARVLIEYYQQFGIEIPQDLKPELQSLGLLK